MRFSIPCGKSVGGGETMHFFTLLLYTFPLNVLTEGNEDALQFPVFFPSLINTDIFTDSCTF